MTHRWLTGSLAIAFALFSVVDASPRTHAACERELAAAEARLEAMTADRDALAAEVAECQAPLPTPPAPPPPPASAPALIQARAPAPSPTVAMPDKVARLVGALTPISTTPYDVTLLKWAAVFEAEYLALGKKGQTAGEMPYHQNYYDAGLVNAQLYYRTGDVRWWSLGLKKVTAWANFSSSRIVRAKYGFGGKIGSGDTGSPRDFGSIGLAIYGLVTDNQLMLDTVTAQARHIAAHESFPSSHLYGFASPVMPFADPREAGYALMTLLTQYVVTGEYGTTARALMERILAKQGTYTGQNAPEPGMWPGYLEGGNYTYVYPWMNGLTAEALVMYDRLIGDPRIRPALKLYADNLWARHWVAAGAGFRYANFGVAGVSDTNPAPILNGLNSLVFAYLAAGGDATARARYDALVAGLVSAANNGGMSHVKAFHQYARTVPRAYGLLP